MCAMVENNLSDDYINVSRKCNIYKMRKFHKRMEYKELLQRAKMQVPKGLQEKERFEIPKVVGHIEGAKTIITNFTTITSTLRRQPEHMLKYLLRELATPGDIRSGRLVLGAKTSAQKINQKIKEYADEFVFCPECGKPDTDIKKEGDLNTLSCSVCGTRRVVKRI